MSISVTPEQFAKDHLANLNDRQREAVLAVDGAILLLAVPGSGKTTVLVTRLGYMVYCCGIAPTQILTMTYTVAATDEMRQRFRAQFGGADADRLTFCTINSLSNRIIDFYGKTYGRNTFQLAEEGELLSLLGEIYQRVNEDYATTGILRDIRTNITYVKNQMLSAEEIRKLKTGIDNFPAIYEQYRAELLQRRAMDFDDQMVYAKRILEQYPEILAAFQNQYRYLCVDESQDTSKIQHSLIRLLAGKNGNLFMVGDEDQSIYGFRAAYPDALVHFGADYPGAKVLLIEENYRSTPEILDAANGFIQKNLYRHKKTIRPTRPVGEAVQIIYTKDRETQIAYLTEAARNADAPAAVLYRNNDSALPLIDRLEGERIGYVCKQMDDAFFSHRIVADITDIIHFAAAPTDAALFLRIYYKLGCCIQKKMAVEACKKSEASGKPILRELLGLPELPDYARDAVIDLSSMLPMLGEDDAEMGLKRIWNRMGYGKYAEDNGLDTNKFTILALLAKRQPSLCAFLEHLNRLHETVSKPKKHQKPKLLLSTIHSSKGLEYDTVYLLDVIDGILPGDAKPPKTEEEERTYYEERRLFYVGMTRAKNRLFLFACGGCDSLFLSELLRDLPRPVRREDDLFSALHGNLCGKHYFSAQNGQGTVIANGEDHCLIAFEDGSIQRLSLGEMLSARASAYQKETKNATGKKKQKRPAKEKIDVQALKRRAETEKTIIHKNFGRGTIVRFQEPYVRVQFPNGKGEKLFSLVDCIKKGILRFED